MINSFAGLLDGSLDQNISAMALLLLVVVALYLWAVPSGET